MDPAEKELWRDAKDITQMPDRMLPQEIGAERLKDERQRILAIGDNEIRKKGMCMAAAFALDPADAQ